MSAQLLLTTPLLLLLILLSVQMAVWMHASHIAQSAAAQALAAARADGGDAATGRAQAALILDQVASGLLQDPRIEVTRVGTEVQARITGTAEAVVPGLRLPINALAHGPAETWTTP